MKQIVILLFIAVCQHSFAQTALKLIPSPQKVEIKDGRFRLGEDPDRSIHIEEASAPINPANADESYQLLVSPTGITIRATGDAGIFYAKQTLKQLIRANSDVDHSIPCCQITDWPTLKYRVWQDDISRGPIPTMDFLKKEIRNLSELKYNAMTLYTEHVFKLNKHPDIAPDDGITAEQIKQLSQYARDYHVEVIGNFQSFGHMARILSLPAYKNLGDNGWNISPAKEESYKFLADCYSEVAPAYSSKLFDINCDEVTLGKEGASKEMVAKLGLAEVYARHINRICELLKPYGKTAMMWGDIAVQHPDIVPKLPKDLIVLSWGYSASDSFDEAIEPFTKIGLRFMVCPGVSCWNRIFPDYKTAQINIANYVRDGVKHGAIGMINTSWDDDGENLFNQTWYPFAWGGELGWNPITNETRDVREKNFDASFAQVFYGAPDDTITRALWRLSELRSNPASHDLSDRGFWQDDFASPDPKMSIENSQKLSIDADEIAETLKEAKKSATLNADTLNADIFAARKTAYMGRSFVLLSGIEKKARAKTPLAAGDLVAVDQLATDLSNLRDDYAELWKMENRPWWLDKNIEKYDNQLAMIRNLPLRVLFSPREGSFAGATDVTLLPLIAGGEIRYTTDGTDPTPQSSLYKDPIHIEGSTTLKVKHFVDGKSAPADSAMYRTFILPATVQTNLQTFEDFGPVRAFDGTRESWFWGNHDGGGIRAGDTFTVTLETPKQASRIAVLTGHRDHSEDTLHQGVVEVSADGKDYQPVAEFKKNGWAEAKLDSPKTIKAVRIRATGDQENWLIIREIAVE